MSRDGWARKRANASGDNGWAERGGYMAAKVSKLDEQFKHDVREKQKQGKCTTIFSGVAIYVNGYTEPNADELRRLMSLHGGQFHVYYSRSKTTHIIANNLPNSKIQELKGEKIMRPEWITDSIKAGRLLPHLQYQLYTKHKGPLFTGQTLRQASEIPGTSHRPHSVTSHEKFSFTNQTTINPVPRRGHYQCNVQPQSSHHSSAAVFIKPPPRCPASGHKGPPDTHLLSDPNSTKTPQSKHHHHNLQHQGANQSEPQADSCHGSDSSGCREVEVKVNGALQTSAGAKTRHPRINEARECGEALHPQVLKEAPLTNGHSFLVNGALKPEDLSAVTDEASDTDLFECSIKSPEVKLPVLLLTKPDPYEFPHSPPKQSKHSPVCVEPTSCKDKEQPPKPPPSHQEAEKSQSTDLIAKQLLELSPGHDSHREKTALAPRRLSYSPHRPNGSHHKDSAALLSTSLTSKLQSPANRPSTSSPLSKSPSQLLVQTGDLISKYYSHSRLHQISTWRIGFSEYVNELHCKRKAAGGASLTGKERLRKSLASHSSDSQGTSSSSSSSSSKRTSCIFHVDMDCFFVSVGIRHRPDLKGKPVAVTSNRGLGRVPARPGANLQVEQQYYQRKHNSYLQPVTNEEDIYRTPSQKSPDSPTNGLNQDAAVLSMAEIASCSYEARQAGVKNGMFFGKAKQVCPSLQSVPYDFEAYKEVALTMYEILASYTHDIEALSCDEVLIDASALLAELGIGAEDLARAIRADIKEKTGCCASVGMGSNILLARLATRRAKPDGQYFLRSEEVDDFIRDLPVTSLPGVGPVMGRKLAAMSVKSCGDLQQVSMNQLQKKFGPRTGQTLFRFCRGLDDRLVRYEKERKSVSAEMNYNIRFTTNDEAECFLTNLAMEVQKRLQEAGLQGRRVTLKVMVRKPGAPVESAKYGGHGICDNLARTVMLAQSTDSGQLIASAVIKLFQAMKVPAQDLRGVGIQVQLLEGNQPVRHEATGRGTRSIKDMLLGQRQSGQSHNRDSSTNQDKTTSTTLPSSSSEVQPCSPEPVPGTSKAQETPKLSRKLLNLSIEVPSPSQVDRSVLEALPPELREQVEQSWMRREGRPNGIHSPGPQTTDPLPPPPPPFPYVSHNPGPSTSCYPTPSGPPLDRPPAGTLVLQIPNQPDGLGIVLELPHLSQVDPEVFAALPKELQDELKSAYNRTTVQPQSKTLEQKNPLLQLKQAGAGIGRIKRRYKRKNAASPVKKRPATNSPAKPPSPLQTSRETSNTVKTENGPSTSSSKPDDPEPQPKFIPRPAPSLAGACELTDIKTLLREWITTITEPMEEDILQVVKYCTDLIEDKDLEKLDLVIKYMKRLMQQSVESVWSMAFDFIVDNIQVVVQQTYGSTLKIA